MALRKRVLAEAEPSVEEETRADATPAEPEAEPAHACGRQHIAGWLIVSASPSPFSRSWRTHG